MKQDFFVTKLYNFSQQGYKNFLYNQKLSETPLPCILGGIMENHTEVSNTKNIFTPPSAPVNLEEDQPEEDFNGVVKNDFIQENFAFVGALKQLQQQQQIPAQQKAFSIHEITSVEKDPLIELFRMDPCI